MDSPRRAEHVGGGERLPAATTTTSTAAAAAAETAAAAAPETPAAVGSSGGLEGTEEKGAEATAAQAAEGGAAAVAAATAMGPGPRFEMVLVPPQDAPVIIIQRLVRGQLMRETYQMLKVLIFPLALFIFRRVAVVCLAPYHECKTGWVSIAAATLKTYPHANFYPFRVCRLEYPKPHVYRAPMRRTDIMDCRLME